MDVINKNTRQQAKQITILKPPLSLPTCNITIDHTNRRKREEPPTETFQRTPDLHLGSGSSPTTVRTGFRRQWSETEEKELPPRRRPHPNRLQPPRRQPRPTQGKLVTLPLSASHARPRNAIRPWQPPAGAHDGATTRRTDRSSQRGGGSGISAAFTFGCLT